jgi:tRNA A37 N6-isopentenylltransferase MiaA
MEWGRFAWVVGGTPSLYQSLAQSWPTLKDL